MKEGVESGLYCVNQTPPRPIYNLQFFSFKPDVTLSDLHTFLKNVNRIKTIRLSILYALHLLQHQFIVDSNPINKLSILINNITHKLLININNCLSMTCLKF